MTFTAIAIALAVFVVVLAKRVRGEAVREPKKLFLLPVVVGLIGLQNVSHARPNSIDIAVIAIGAAVSLSLGLLRGKFDRVTLVNGSPFMSWTAASIAVFAGNVLAKLALDAGGVAAGGTSSALGSSILLSLGLTLLGEAAVVFFRSQSLTSGGPGTFGGPGATAGPGISGGSGSAQYRGTVRKSGRPTNWPPIR
jgi:uncharacterized membrane protein YidH (DUF202 family)